MHKQILLSPPLPQALTEIQAALRGHMNRRHHLQKFEDDPDMTNSDDAIVDIQSAMRGHLARRKHREEPEGEWSGGSGRRLQRERLVF